MYHNQNYPYFNAEQPYFNHPMQSNNMNPYAMNTMSTFPRNRMYQKPINRAFANFNYYNFLEGTQKTLTTINQIIPIVNQVSPMIRNATMLFKVANVINTIPSTNLNETPATSSTTNQKTVENPTLF